MSVVNKVPKHGTIVEWKYNTPDHSMTPKESLEVALQIHAQFKQLLERKYSVDEAIMELKSNKDILHFSGPNCFPMLFALATKPDIHQRDIEALVDMVKLRDLVNSGHLTEMQGEAQALSIAARVKSKL